MFDIILNPDDQAALRPQPLFMTPVHAGFPSPADDYIEGKLDLNEYLVRHPAATYFVRATGDSMIEDGIRPGDILVVDRALETVDGSIVIAAVDGELTVKRLRISAGRLFLVPGNEDYHPIEVTEDMDSRIWGVVTAVIHELRGRHRAGR